MEKLKKERIEKLKQEFEEKKKNKLGEKDKHIQEASSKIKRPMSRGASKIHSII